MDQIVAPLRLHMKRPTVKDLHEGLTLLGFAIRDAEASEQRFGAETRAAVIAFQQAHQLPETGEVDEATAQAMNTALVDRGVLEPGPGGVDGPTPTVPDEKTLSVEGEVVRPDGTPLPGHTVRALDRAVGTWRPLGEARSNEAGQYVIRYERARLEDWGKTRADLRVEVLEPGEPAPGSSPRVLASSALILQALPRETVDFSIGVAPYRGVDEFTRVEHALAPHLGAHDDWGGLNTGDMLILAREAGVRASLAAYYVKARRWADERGMDASLFYGLMRGGESTSLDTLVARSLGDLLSVLADARRTNVIGAASDETIRTQVSALQRDYLAEPEHPYTKLLATTTLEEPQRTAFTTRLTAGTETGDAFWDALAKDERFSAGDVTELRGLFELQAFVGNNTSLTLRLRDGLGVRDPREVAAFGEEYWYETVLTDAIDVPEDLLPRGTVEARRRMYARLLFAGAEASYPTASLVGQMQRSEAWAEHQLLEVFAAYPGFELRDDRVVRFLREHPDALDGVSDRDAARTDLLRLEQLFHLAPDTGRLSAIQPMWDAGLSTPTQVAYLGRQQLIRRLGDAVGVDATNGIYRRAVHATSKALNVFVRYHPGLNRLSLNGLKMPGVPDTALPDWEALFGSVDACECSPCESTLSPAAYLVDCLAFLQRAVGSGSRDALDELLERRPDLGTLKLTCENTETEMPLIDVVIEVLEAIVASRDGQTLPAGAIGETTWDGAQLAAQPEHLNPAAYEILRTAVHPLEALPFDLWAEEGRRYLARIGIQRDELMRRLPAHPGVGPVEIATETLRMTEVERAAICTPTTREPEVARRWGLDLAAGPLGQQLKDLDALLAQARIDYDALRRLLNTRYVNPDRTITVSFAGGPCSLGGAVLAGEGDQALTGTPLRAFLDRLDRFRRLTRRLACTEYELDGLIAALGVSDFDHPTFIPRLADVQALRTALGTNLPELSSWWSPHLDTYVFDEEPSQYTSIFLNPAFFPDTRGGDGPDLRNDVFALSRDGADLAITASADADLDPWLAQVDRTGAYVVQPDYAAYIQTATGLAADELLSLVQSDLIPKDAATGHVALNLAVVSLLYRAASLARALGVGIVDLLRLTAIVGVGPLRAEQAPAGPTETRRFHDLAHDISAGTVSVEELAYLLLQDADAAAALGPSTDDVDAWFTATSPGVTGIVTLDDPRLTDDVRASVAQSLGSSLGLDPEVVLALLFTHRPRIGADLLAHLMAVANPDAPDLPVSDSERERLFATLHKFALAWQRLALDSSALPFVLDMGPKLGWTDIAALPPAGGGAVPFEAWNRLAAATALQASSFTTDQSLFALIESARAAGNDPDGFDQTAWLGQVSEWSGWPVADLTYLTGDGGFGFSLPLAMGDERAFVALSRVFDLIRPTGAGAQQAHRWTVAGLGSTEAQSIKQTLALAYAPEAWLDVLGSIQDELRTLRRDALLGHLLNRLGMKDSAEFYRHYLIDADHAPCARTSRMAEAHAAVQRFAQRILLGLEPFTLTRADAEAWQWRRRYRVWEAARRVFLHPENWLEPEWRDNKSVFFEDLEAGLLQDDVTHATAERLYLDYLHKVNDVSRLEITGLYLDEDPAIGVETLHVFGRSHDAPYRHYYRRWEDRVNWTPWEPVDLDIAGDHVVPVVHYGRLYLFWPDFSISDNPDATTTTTTTVESDPELADSLREQIAEHQRRIDEIDRTLSSPIVQSPNYKGPTVVELETERAGHEAAIATLQEALDGLLVERTEIVRGDQYLVELGMSWSEYRDGRWTGKHASRDTLSYTTSDSVSRHYFTGWVDLDNVLRISARINKTGNGEGIDQVRAAEGYIGYFFFDQSGRHLLGSRAEVSDPAGTVGVVGALPEYHTAWWTNSSWSNEWLELEVSPEGERRTLVKSSGRLHYLHQFGQYGIEEQPFFFSDGTRTYLVEPLPNAPIYRAGSIAVSSSRIRAAADETARTAGTGSVLTGGAGQGAVVVAEQLTTQHFNRADTATIVDRGETASTVGFHEALDRTLEADLALGDLTWSSPMATAFRYRFTRFHHPHTLVFLQQLHRHGIDGLLNPDPTSDPTSADLYRQLMPSIEPVFDRSYVPDHGWVSTANLGSNLLEDAIDFEHGSASGGYAWELFFHIPMLVATHLMRHQRFADARRWFHSVFDPTSTDAGGPERFWTFRPFYEEQRDGSLATLESLLVAGSAAYDRQVEEWEQDPFQPHAVARLRITAYMQVTVMRYLDCLIQEADALFTRDTREDVNEAHQLYQLASEILGERPTVLPAEDPPTATPNLLLGRFGRILEALDHDLLQPLVSVLFPSAPALPLGRTASAIDAGSLPVDPGMWSPPGWSAPGPGPAQGGVTTLDTLLLFCLPYNDRLYDYWDTVADRLFKVRHCMNLSGQLRSLALYAPRIDPASLVRASAAGLRIESVVAGLSAPPPIYRFNVLLQKALELTSVVRGFGAALLAALEKRDGEQVGLLRSTQEVALLELVRTVKQTQVDEAEASLASLARSREAAELRAAYYASRERISAGEQQSLDQQESSRRWQMRAEFSESLASSLHLIPYTYTGTSMQVAFGGPHLGAAAQAVAAGFRGRAAALAYAAGRAGTTAGYTRRAQDWKLQADLARKEIEQLDSQIAAAELRKQSADADLANHLQQTAQAQEVATFLQAKFTGQELYGWMVSKLSAVHFQSYQLAYQLAVQAESAFHRELGPGEQDLTFVQPTNWDSLHKGLTAGELLDQQLRQMDAAYVGANVRELEMTKHVSLHRFDPGALLALRQTGACEFHLPEVVFDMDVAGHYYRRIKAVRVSLPCVVGPYTNVSARLRLTSSWTRSHPDLTDAAQPMLDHVAAPQSAIATSSASQDGGLFDLSFGDPRYLPFEGAGAISSWRLELPAGIRPFDYGTIADVVLHISYTARDGGEAMRASVEEGLVSALNDLTALVTGGSTMCRLFSLRQEFPGAWNQLMHTRDQTPRSCTLELTKRQFPAFLDYIWEAADDAPPAPAALTLDIKGLSAFLSPRGPVPADASNLLVNAQTGTDAGLGAPEFDLVDARETLSSWSLDNDSRVECGLTIEGALRPEQWSDLYLLMHYEVLS